MIWLVVALSIALACSVLFNVCVAALYSDYRTRLNIALTIIGNKSVEDLLRVEHADLEDLPN